MPIIGTSPDSIDLAEDRERFQKLVQTARPAAAAERHRAQSPTRPSRSRAEIGYPLVVRPSYVLGGRAMEIVYTDADLSRYMPRRGARSPTTRPVLLDRFLDDAVEVDVDVIARQGRHVLIGGVMEHIEEAGVHSGDSVVLAAAVSLSSRRSRTDLREQTRRARARR